ncbi:MAG: ABC transporter permease [Armatimonadota bacterium]
MRAIAVIAGRELRAYLTGMIGYVVATVFLLLSGYFFIALLLNPFGPPDTRYWFGNVTITLLIVVPAITMRLLAEERRSGTIELLMTSPVTEWQVVLGKYAGSMAFYALILALLLQYPILLAKVSSPDPGPIVSGFLGLVLFGGLFIAIGLLFSSLTKNQIIAFVTTFGILLALYIIDWMAGTVGPPWGDLLTYLSVRRHLENFAKGLIDTRDVVFYVTTIALMLYMATRSLASAKAWGGE